LVSTIEKEEQSGIDGKILSSQVLRDKLSSLSAEEIQQVSNLVKIMQYTAIIEATKVELSKVVPNAFNLIKLADMYKDRARLQNSKNSKAADYAEAERILTGLLGEKTEIESMKANLIVVNKGQLQEKDVDQALYLAIISLGEVYLAQEKYEPAALVLPAADSNFVAQIQGLVGKYFKMRDANDLIGRVFLAKGAAIKELVKNSQKFEQLKKGHPKELPADISEPTVLLEEARNFIKRVLPNSSGEATKKLETQLKNVEVSLAEAYLSKKTSADSQKALSQILSLTKATDYKGITFESIKKAFEAVGERANREDLILRSSFVAVDALKNLALENKDKVVQKEQTAKATQVLEEMAGMVKKGSADYYRYLVTLAEAYVSLKKNDQALALLAIPNLPQAQADRIPLVSFKDVPEKGQADYTLRANLALIEAYGNKKDYGKAKKVVGNLSEEIKAKRLVLSGEQEADATRRMNNISFYAEYSELGKRLAALASNDADLAEEVTPKSREKALLKIKEFLKDYNDPTNADSFRKRFQEIVDKDKEGTMKEDLVRMDTRVSLKIFMAVQNFEIGDNDQKIKALYASDKYPSDTFGEISRPPETMLANLDRPLDQELYGYLYDMSIRVNQPNLSSGQVTAIKDKIRKGIGVLREKANVEKRLEPLKGQLAQAEIDSMVLEYTGNFQKLWKVLEDEKVWSIQNRVSTKLDEINKE
jgi:hypothetical protein